MTTLAAYSLDDADMLDLFADRLTPLGKPFADAFRDACRAEANIAGSLDDPDPCGPVGWINPNHVRERLIDRLDYKPRTYSAQWSAGFLAKTDEPVRIDPTHSRGNGNKSTVWRKWRDE